jgi:hypothetical protein
MPFVRDQEPQRQMYKIFWGDPPGAMSQDQRQEAKDLSWGHEIVFTRIMDCINAAQFNIEVRWHHASKLEGILRRDPRFFSFVEGFCIQMRLSPEASAFGGEEGVRVLELMLASARGWPLGPGLNAGVALLWGMQEHQRIFGV